jgi:hypothetical protein
MAAQESEDIVPASELNDHVCDALDCVIRGALAQRPSERYANPGELASVLASVELRHRRASQPPTLVQYDLASVHQPLAAQPLNSCAEHESESHAELGSESHAELGSESHAELGSELHAELGSESHAELGDEATAPNTIEAEPALAPIAWGAPTEARISIAPEPAIQATPRRMTGIGLPLLGALLSLAAYVVYPYVMPPRRHAAHRTAASAPVRAEASIAAPAPTFTSAAAVSGSEPVHPISEVKPAPSEVHFLQLAIDGAISPAAVRSGLERIRPALSSCYRHASDLAEQTRIPKLHVTFTIDETGHPRDARLTSGPASVDECVSQAVDKFASTPATTGTASVSTDLRFGS